MMKNGCADCSKQMDIIGRVFIAALFIMAGIGKFMDIPGTVGYMSAYNVPMAGVLVWIAAIFLVVAGVLLIVGWKRCLIAGLLGAYTILVTLIFHVGEGQMVAFLKNVAVLGGLCMVMASCKGSCGMKMGGKKEEKMMAGEDHDHAGHDHANHEGHNHG